MTVYIGITLTSLQELFNLVDCVHKMSGDALISILTILPAEVHRTYHDIINQGRSKGREVCKCHINVCKTKYHTQHRIYPTIVLYIF